MASTFFISYELGCNSKDITKNLLVITAPKAQQEPHDP
jgi:hypothetical protein